MKVKQKIMLDVGCGENCQEGFVGMDKRRCANVQIEHDAESTPWPLNAGTCAVVVMSHFMEHVKPWFSFDVVNEAWRVLDKDGLLMMAMPYGGSARYYQDPTHCNPWTEVTPFYFSPGDPLYNIYKPKPWRIEKLYWDLRGDIELAMRKINE